MHWHSYLNSAVTIIKFYNGLVPFASWLKDYFKQNKKFGSRDRKIISDLCYCYYRLGKSFTHRSIEDRIVIAQFLCHADSLLIKETKPEWFPYSSSLPAEKSRITGEEYPINIFPFLDELSSEIDKEQFHLSHLIQPDLFLRIRPGKKEIVIQKLQTASIPFTLEESCLRLPIASKVDNVIEIDKELVVQDKSSQQVLNPLEKVWQKASFSSWDCCAASGGKTILLHDHYPKAQLTVSDVRQGILHNLQNRFKRAGIQQYQSFMTDISSANFHSNKKYDVIICDAPCSGSGTWGRTPEQLTFFTKEKIDHYVKLQKAISINAAKNLKEGGVFIYITCSVYKKENEEVVEHIQKNTSLQLVSQQYFKGYTEKADTLFAALFKL